MTKPRKSIRKAGKKSGAHIKNPYALRPMGIKTSGFEFPIRGALVALESGVADEENMVMLWTLGDIAERMGGEKHVMTHAATLKRLCLAMRDNEFKASNVEYVAIETSANLLVNWLHQQSNFKIATEAKKAIHQLGV